MDNYLMIDADGNPLTDPLWVMRFNYSDNTIGEIRFFAKNFQKAQNIALENVPVGFEINYLSRH